MDTNEEIKTITAKEKARKDAEEQKSTEKVWDRFIRNTSIFLSSAEA